MWFEKRSLLGWACCLELWDFKCFKEDATSIQMAFYLFTSTSVKSNQNQSYCVFDSCVEEESEMLFAWKVYQPIMSQSPFKAACPLPGCFQMPPLSLLTPAQWHPFPCIWFFWMSLMDRWWEEMGKLENVGYFSRGRNNFERKDGARKNIGGDTRSGKYFLLWPGALWQTQL